MKKLIQIFTIMFFAAVVFLAGCATTKTQSTQEPKHKHDKFTKHLADSQLLVTEKGLYSVEMAISGKRLLVGVNNIDLIVHDANDTDVKQAEIEFTPWMPEMGHGVFDPPVLTEKGDGLYRVENVVLVMGGHWEIRINIKKDGVEDKVVFDFPYVRTNEEYDYIREKTPAGYNAVLGMKNPLKEAVPEIITENGEEIKAYTLTVKNLGFEIFPDQPMMGWGFDGVIPGPTFRVKEGDKVRITLKNEADDSHTMHIHGIEKPVIADGVPYIGQKPVEKGESYTFEFTAGNIGTHWYHCHVDSSHHVDMGLYGVFIVEPKEEILEYDREYIMVLDEWPTAHIHRHGDPTDLTDHEKSKLMKVHESSTPGGHAHPMELPAKRDYYPRTHWPRNDVYDGFTINGRSFPMTQPIDVKEGEKVRIRFVNVGYMSHFMHTHSHKFKVVARDGSYVNEPQLLDTVEIGPAQRVDIILYANNPGIWPFHCHRLNHVANEGAYPGGMLTFIRYID